MFQGYERVYLGKRTLLKYKQLNFDGNGKIFAKHLGESDHVNYKLCTFLLLLTVQSVRLKYFVVTLSPVYLILNFTLVLCYCQT